MFIHFPLTILPLTSERIGVEVGAIHTGPETTCRITRGPMSEPL
jgi:hypothetical protein